MFEKTGSRGVRIGVWRRYSASRCWAGRIRSEWNAQATGSVSRRSPRSVHLAIARSMPARVPEMTVCSGAFRFARVISGSRGGPAGRPGPVSTAAIAPLSSAVASRMKRPRASEIARSVCLVVAASGGRARRTRRSCGRPRSTARRRAPGAPLKRPGRPRRGPAGRRSSRSELGLLALAFVVGEHRARDRDTRSAAAPGDRRGSVVGRSSHSRASGKATSEVAAHVDVLRALTGEQERDAALVGRVAARRSGGRVGRW